MDDSLDGLEDIPVIEDILQSLHPNIKWEVNVRGPGVPHQVKPDGTIVDMSVLHHLDLKIQIIDGKIETDVFAKDVPNYISRRSCHPPNLFPGILKSIGIRLRTNCSLDTFLDNRIEEYTRYLLASGYTRKEVHKVMEETRAMDRAEIIQRPRRRRGMVSNQKKFALISKYDPRQPNVKDGLKLLEEILYLNEENKEAFPKGSIIAGFRRQQNLGEMIAPSKPRRQATPAADKGCFPCNPLRSCGLHEGGNLQTVDHVRPLYDGRRHNINKKVDCLTTNAVYYIYCPCAHPSDYVGSAQNGMRDRWNKHRSDIRNGRWTACGVARHFGDHHRNDIEEALKMVEVTVLDRSRSLEDLKSLEDRWMCDLGTVLGPRGLNRKNEVLGNNRQNFGHA